LIETKTPGSTQSRVTEAEIAAFIDSAGRLGAAVAGTILGQEEVVRQTIIALLADGHVLLEGVPGLGKTLLVRTLGRALGLSFSRVQFTPDLMPADITGTTILREDDGGRRSFAFQPGPLFAHLLLADEINRATPKTQSALLEAMQEHTVTAGNDTHQLPAPFFVLATQNPIEQEGTYPLPEAQLDRFLLKVLVPFPEAATLKLIALQTLATAALPEAVIDGTNLPAMMLAARAVPIADSVLDYAVELVVNTHPDRSSLESIRQFVSAGASPRGLQALVTCGQVRALLEGRYNVAIEDLNELAHPALRHRLLLNFEAHAEGVTSDDLIDQLIERSTSAA
jgi:MoxR-like ATPase